MPWRCMNKWRYSSTILHFGTRGRWVVTSLPAERASGTHWIGGWVGFRAGLNAVEEIKLFFPCQESNRNYPVSSSATSCYFLQIFSSAYFPQSHSLYIHPLLCYTPLQIMGKTILFVFLSLVTISNVHSLTYIECYTLLFPPWAAWSRILHI
jgi:hypothetical protein